MEFITPPHLYCPFQSAINPHASRIQEGAIEWARRLQLLERDAAYRRLNRLQYGMLIARAYPTASLVPLQIVADWCTWLFLLDDQCDEAGIGHNPEQLTHLHSRLLDVLSGMPPHVQDQPLIHGLWDLYIRLRACTSERWQQRFRTSVGLYFAANVWEATNRQTRAIPDATTYRAMRPFTSAVYPCLLLIEVADQLDLPSELHDHAVIQVLAQLTNNVISWANDLVSLEKERQQGDVHNLALILAHEEELPLNRAVARVAELHDAEVRAFITLSARLPKITPTVDADLSRFVMGMRFWMRANLDWSQAAMRYRSAATQPVVV